jgi:peptidoglycan/xylan/chitin deacetylase (PgdA/CDA1 family)
LLHTLLALRDVLAPILRFHEVSILCYHSVADDPSDTTIAPDSFDRQLSMLERSGAQFVSLDDVVAWQQGSMQLPRRAVALTFDDGYTDFVSNALPILEKHNAKATLFVLGDTHAARRYLENDTPTLAEADIERLHAHPLVEIGYHSLTHAALGACDERELARECAPRYGARFFAYPGGDYNDTVLEAVRKAHYTAACTIKPVLVTRGRDPLRLPRTVVLRGMSERALRAYTTYAATWYRTLRRAVRRVI